MAYTPTVYTNDASSPDLNATNLNKSEQGIKDAHLIAVPVDCSSRVAEYTGDGISLIPDNVAGTTYRSNFTTIDGFASNGATFSVSNNVLQITNTSTSNIIYRSLSSTPNGKMHTIRFRAPAGLLVQLKYYNGSIYTAFAATTSNGSWQQLSGYLSSGGTANYFYMNVAGASTVYYISDVYIGTGAYDYQNKDRAGNGNSLTLNAVTPVNGKYCKEMSFNGSSSFAQASSPVIGTTGTIAIRFKRGNTGLSGLFGNSSAETNGILAYFFPNNVLAFYFSNGTTMTTHLTKTYSNTTDYNTVIINSNGQVFIDGSLSAFSIPTTWIAGLDSLYIGLEQRLGGYFNGIISHFRYDSRVWTADEARAWSLNPISIDSRV